MHPFHEIRNLCLCLQTAYSFKDNHCILQHIRGSMPTQNTSYLRPVRESQETKENEAMNRSHISNNFDIPPNYSGNMVFPFVFLVHKPLNVL